MQSSSQPPTQLSSTPSFQPFTIFDMSALKTALHTLEALVNENGVTGLGNSSLLRSRAPSQPHLSSDGIADHFIIVCLDTELHTLNSDEMMTEVGVGTIPSVLAGS
jgi:predicted xylose isomerase-like sugar epimerase